MKFKENISVYLVFLLVIAIALLGAYLADVIDNFYPFIARGVLGLTVIYHIIRHGPTPSMTDPVVYPFKFLRNVKYIASVVFGGAIFYWAIRQVLFMIAAIIE